MIVAGIETDTHDQRAGDALPCAQLSTLVVLAKD